MAFAVLCDADSTRVIVTVANDYVTVEDNSGMDAEGVEKFLTMGSIHKQQQLVSKKFNRPLTGRYGIGTMSFLAFSELRSLKCGSGLESLNAGAWTGAVCITPKEILGNRNTH